MQTPSRHLALSLTVAVVGWTAHPVWGQSKDGRDWSRETARDVPDWVRDAVVYEVFPRAFSPEGSLAGVTSRLDHVRDLGATVLWLMPIHPIGAERRKGTQGSPYSIRDFHSVNPDYGTGEDLHRLVREAHARGLKVILDVVVNHTSWDSVMMRTPELYPGLFLLAEWSTPDLMAKAFDADYAWPFHAALNRVLSLGAPASGIRATWEDERRNFPRGSLHLRFSDNHDEKRAIARFGEPAALCAQALVFTMDGIPLVYNGMEIGDTTESGGPALTERLPIFWPIVERRPEFPSFYRSMIALRASHPALRRGETVWVTSSGPDRVVSFVRRGAGEDVLVAVNLSSQPWAGRVEAPAGPPFVEITPAVPLPQQPGGASPPRTAREVALPALALDAWGFRLFSRTVE